MFFFSKVPRYQNEFELHQLCLFSYTGRKKTGRQSEEQDRNRAECYNWRSFCVDTGYIKKEKKNEPADPEKVTVESNWDIISAQFLFRWLSVFANPLSFEICINNPSATMKGGINVSRIIEEIDFGIDVA